MTRNEYLNALQAAMTGLPEEEVRRTLDYYDELISDAVEAGESEQQAVGTLPAPEDVANDLRPRAQQRMHRRGGLRWVLAGMALCGAVALTVMGVQHFNAQRAARDLVEDVPTAPVAAEPADGEMRATVLTYETDQLSAFDLQSDFLPIEVIGEDRTDIELTYYDRAGWTAKAEVNGKKLELRYGSMKLELSAWPSFDGDDWVITLRVPLDYEAEYEISSSMSSLRLRDCAGDMDLSADMGSIAVTGCAAERLTVNSDMGSAELKNSSGRRLEVRCDMGAIELKAMDYQELELDCGMGSVEGTLSGARTDYTVTLESDISSCNIEEGGDGSRTLSVECDMGQVDLDFLED